jgi:NAD(P)-dependent dehydrogenase (short-subunit alcohol dehydrogenase family)
MRCDLSGKKALITGSSGGIGFAIAKALHARGCKVALNARNLDRLKKSASQLNGSVAIGGDVTKSEEAKTVINDAMKSLGQLDILVCSVGGGASVGPGFETLEEWHRVFALNFWSATNVIEAASEGLSNNNGVILCISSICGLEVIPGAPLTYSASKAALNSYVKGLARPLGKRGIRINAIAPGNIFFEGSIWDEKLKQNQELVVSMLEKDVPLKKFGTPEDVANLAVYLVSNESNFATGGVWALDGGQTH